MRLGGCTATGPRDANEDSFYVIDFSAVGSFANGVTSFAMVSDGMGGYQGGDVASGLAVSSAERYIDLLLEMAKGNRVEFDAVLALTEIVQNAHEAIVAESDIRGNTSMGATFVGAFLSPTHAWIGHVGDSRAYLLHGGEAIQLTEDHSQVGRLLKQGLITEEEAQSHPARNRIDRALGFTDTAPDITEVELGLGDGLLMCSDGVYTVLNALSIAACTAKARDAEGAARRVVKSALSAGTDDNSTAVVVLPGSAGESSPSGHGRKPTIRTAPVSSARRPSVSRSHMQVASKSRSSAGRPREQGHGKSRIPYIVIPLILFVALVAGAVMLFVGSGSERVSGMTTSSTAASFSAAPSHPTASSQQPVMVEYVVINEVPIRYLDGGGIAQDFGDNPLYIEAVPYLLEGAPVWAGSDSDNYGRGYVYRKLDDMYLEALRSDCNSYRNGASEYDSGLAVVADPSQYSEFVTSLAETGMDYEITGLVAYADNLAVLRE